MAKAKTTTGAPTRAGTAVANKFEEERTPLSERMTAIKESRKEKGSLTDPAFEFLPNSETGVITARISLPNGDTIGAQGATREEAVTNLEKRLESFPK